MPSSSEPLFASHPRSFAENLYVYPVLSRRAGGISVGINLNRDQFCNFHCVYCQVERTGKPIEKIEIDLQRLAEELHSTLELWTSGRLFLESPFNRTPDTLRQLRDIAFSGDGEPTAFRNFSEAVAVCAQAKKRHHLDNVKLVLITNASLLHCEHVRNGLDILDNNNGEIWAKLDAGTEGYYRQVSRSPVAWQQILDNLRETAKVRPIVIQTLFLRIHEQLPPPEEITAYCQRLQEITAAGGKIKLVQIHTLARRPAEAYVAPLKNAEIDALVERVRRETGLSAAGYYSE